MAAAKSRTRDLCEKARDNAFRLMLDHTAPHGANTVVGARYDANEVVAGVADSWRDAETDAANA
jgi:uncharacterized protein YbjQ (UPF0145 family)